jgi:hypothetical protein
LLKERKLGLPGVLDYTAAEPRPRQLFTGVSSAQYFVNDLLRLPPKGLNRELAHVGRDVFIRPRIGIVPHVMEHPFC